MGVKRTCRLVKRHNFFRMREIDGAVACGGLISAALLAVPGASAYFLGSAVVYTRVARRTLMDMPDDTMRGIRSASEPYAKMLASQIRSRLSSA